MKRIRPGRGKTRGPLCDHTSECDFPTSAETAGKNVSPHPGSSSLPTPSHTWLAEATDLYIGISAVFQPSGLGDCLSVCLSVSPFYSLSPLFSVSTMTQ